VCVVPASECLCVSVSGGVYGFWVPVLDYVKPYGLVD
jgi:hypothetical protein